MTSTLVRRAVFALAATLFAVPLFLAAPASAQGASPCPAGQPPGRPPGTPPGPPETDERPPEGRPSQYTSRSECALQLDQSSASAGEQVTLAGSGYRPGSAVELTLNSAPISLGAATTDGSGAFTKVITIPAAAPIGSHTITAAGVNPAGAQFVLSAAFDVTAAGGAGQAAAAPTSSAGDNTLPRTGTSTALLITAAAALIGIGAFLVMTARRRRAHVPA